MIFGLIDILFLQCKIRDYAIKRLGFNIFGFDGSDYCIAILIEGIIIVKVFS